MPIVPASETVIHPRTMVIAFRHAVSAEAAMFAASRFGLVTGSAVGLWSEEDVVVGPVAETSLEAY